MCNFQYVSLSIIVVRFSMMGYFSELLISVNMTLHIHAFTHFVIKSLLASFVNYLK